MRYVLIIIKYNFVSFSAWCHATFAFSVPYGLVPHGIQPYSNADTGIFQPKDNPLGRSDLQTVARRPSRTRATGIKHQDPETNMKGRGNNSGK